MDRVRIRHCRAVQRPGHCLNEPSSAERSGAIMIRRSGCAELSAMPSSATVLGLSSNAAKACDLHTQPSAKPYQVAHQATQDLASMICPALSALQISDEARPSKQARPRHRCHSTDIPHSYPSNHSSPIGIRRGRAYPRRARLLSLSIRLAFSHHSQP